MDIICDIDGVLADPSHRQHYLDRAPPDWDAYFKACEQDAPIKPMCALIRHSAVYSNIAFMTGRPERVRRQTASWLQRWVKTPRHLYMRQDGDHAPEYEIKRALLKQVRADGLTPTLAFDDRINVGRMWQEEGLVCLLMAETSYA